MGLAFLNKKSWHTGSFKNIADVWLAQEKAKEQKRKREEIRKKLIEEKYSEGLKKMQVEAGLLHESALNRMEWMHNMHENLESKNNAESYLLGKPVQNLEKEAQNLQDNDNANDTNEDFVRLLEDPLFQMQKEKEKRKQELMNNPVKMEHLIAEVAALRKEKNKKKKEKHRSRSRSRNKEKKKDKKKRHRSSSSRSDGSRKKSKSKKDKKHKEERSHKDKSREKNSSEAPTEDKVFGDYMRKRLGPLVEFDEDTYRFKFLAKEKFKNNDPKKMSKEERDQMLQQMKKNAEVYENTKMNKYAHDTKDDGEHVQTGEFIQKAHQQAIDQTGISGVGENISRSKFFHDKKLARSHDE